jgi:phosphoribosylanthranilate isomerase
VTIKTKICGVTLADDAAVAAAAGADFIGLNFWERSKRYLDPARAPIVAGVARGAGSPLIVGVFVDAQPDEIAAVHAAVGLDRVQLHGDEHPDDVKRVADAVGVPVWKAIAVRDARDLAALDEWPVEAILLDAPSAGRGGSGQTFDWVLATAAERAPARPLVLAGGLTPENVGAAIARVRPWAVDVASGVERAPGVKDHDKVRAFIAAVRGAP